MCCFCQSPLPFYCCNCDDHGPTPGKILVVLGGGQSLQLYWTSGYGMGGLNVLPHVCKTCTSTISDPWIFTNQLFCRSGQLKLFQNFVWGRDNTKDRAFALYRADLVSILSSTYGPLSTTRMTLCTECDQFFPNILLPNKSMCLLSGQFGECFSVA